MLNNINQATVNNGEKSYFRRRPEACSTALLDEFAVLGFVRIVPKQLLSSSCGYNNAAIYSRLIFLILFL